MRNILTKYGMTSILFIDVDGYCSGGIDQSKIISKTSDGYRARELGWIIIAGGLLTKGSIYFYDEDSQEIDKSHTWYAEKIHGLSVVPVKESFNDNEIACPSHGLLKIISILSQTACQKTGTCDQIIVHKGGNEGKWASLAAPYAYVIDMNILGCPRVDVLYKNHADWDTGIPCRHHASLGCDKKKKHKGGMVHCPAVEICYLFLWLALEYK